MTKVIFLIEQPLDERNYDRFGIQTWIARGWVVEVWDLTALAHPPVWKTFIESGHKLRAFEGYFPIASQRQLDRRFSELSKAPCVIDLTGDNRYSIRVKMRLAHLRASRVTCTSGSIPSLIDEGKRGLAAMLRKIFSRKLLDVLARILLAPFIKPALLVVTGENSIPSGRRNPEILRAHNLDYDIYLKIKPSLIASSEKYAVFLDQNICFHPEYIYTHTSSYTMPERYFPALCGGLRKISIALDIPVRIAAHPRLPRQKKYTDYFGGMPIEYGRTAELIGNCEFVVCHYTTAIQLAVLFEKPVLFVTTDDLADSFVGRYIEKFAATLGKSAINLDGDLDIQDWRAELRVDPRKYREYRQKYIKTDGSPEIPYWDIVIDYLAKARGPLSAERAMHGTCASYR